MRRRRKPEEPENHDRWVVSYADFITLLFAFFVVMYAISTVDAKKFENVSASLKEALFEKPPVAMPIPLAGLGGDSPAQRTAPAGPAGPPLGLLRDRIATGLERGPASAANDAVRMTTTPRGLVISLAASRFFAESSAELTAEALPVLESIGAVLAPLRLAVRVEGHTDDRPIATERYPSNWELSAARATAVVRYLQEQHGLAPERLTASAYAAYRPVAPNADDAGRARNRRVDVVVLSPLEAMAEPDPVMQEMQAREALDALR